MEARRTFVVRADVCLGDNPRRMSLAIYNCMVMPNNIFQALDPGNIVQELEGIQEPGAAAAVQRATAAAAEVVTISSQERLVQLRDREYFRAGIVRHQTVSSSKVPDTTRLSTIFLI
jgi:hypothetical protein